MGAQPTALMPGSYQHVNKGSESAFVGVSLVILARAGKLTLANHHHETQHAPACISAV
jgi:hypothetical protein